MYKSKYAVNAARFALPYVNRALQDSVKDLGRRAVNSYKRYQKAKPTVKRDGASLNSNSNTSGKSKYSSKKRYVRKRKSQTKINKLSKSVKELRRTAEADQGVLTFRSRITGRNVAAVNAASYADLGILSTSFYETVLAQLRYYDPTAPATLVQADGTTGSFMKDFLFSKVYVRLVARNNYQVPCTVVVYSCNVKEDTSIQCLTAMTNGLADVGNPTATSPLVYPTDSPQFSDLWKIVKTSRKVLQPGEEIVVTHSAKSFFYDPSLVDSHAVSFQARYSGFGMMIRCEGVLAHDTTLDEQGTIACGVDYQVTRTCQVKYAAGADIEYLYVTDGSDAFTNGALVSSKPVSDNIGYSIA